MGQQPAQQTTPLPSFRYDWTGNDIRGIHALAATVYGYVPPSLGVVDKLNASVNRLVRAAGWQGLAAQRFRSVWEKNSAEAVTYCGLMNSGGEILDNLAVRLAWIQNWWESRDPDPDVAYKKGLAAAQAQIKEAVDGTAKALNGLSANKLAPAAAGYIKDGTISAADEKFLQNALRISLGSPSPKDTSRPGPGIDQDILNSRTVIDAAGFGGVGASVGTLVGGGLGLLGGPFAEITVPVGAGAGAIIGGSIGFVTGAVWGLGEDLHFW